jgi:hypothetical protein
MSIYAEELVAELEGILEYIEILFAKFNIDTPPPDLLLDVATLQNRLESVDRIMPAGIDIHWERKLQFLNYYIELSNSILPEAIRKVKELGSTSTFLDAELRAAVSPLVRTQQFSSAIRTAFVLLTERMRKRFDLPGGVDGAVMVNAIFGSGSAYFPRMTNSERQARRDYIAGLYGVLRNKYAHSDPPLDPVELEAVLSGVNLALKLIG